VIVVVSQRRSVPKRVFAVRPWKGPLPKRREPAPIRLSLRSCHLRRGARGDPECLARAITCLRGVLNGIFKIEFLSLIARANNCWSNGLGSTDAASGGIGVIESQKFIRATKKTQMAKKFSFVCHPTPKLSSRKYRTPSDHHPTTG
jgi:hypothetical protein